MERESLLPRRTNQVMQRSDRRVAVLVEAVPAVRFPDVREQTCELASPAAQFAESCNALVPNLQRSQLAEFASTLPHCRTLHERDKCLRLLLRLGIRLDRVTVVRQVAEEP